MTTSAYLTMESSTFARLARAFSISLHFAAVLVQATTSKLTLCSCVVGVSTEL